jgi:hypothetical protein
MAQYLACSDVDMSLAPSSKATIAQLSDEESAITNTSRANRKLVFNGTNLIFGCRGGFQSSSPKR